MNTNLLEKSVHYYVEYRNSLGVWNGQQYFQDDLVEAKKFLSAITQRWPEETYRLRKRTITEEIVLVDHTCHKD